MSETYWDPVYASLDAEAVNKKNEKLLKKIQSYSQAPGTILQKRLLLAYVISLFVILFVVLYANDFRWKYFGTSVLNNGMYYGLIPLIPCLICFFDFRSTKKDLEEKVVLFDIASKNAWLANATSHPEHWGALCSHFPEVFDKGDENQHMYDELWGQADGKDFYLGTFQYTIVRIEQVTTTDANGNKKTETRKVRIVHREKILAIQLDTEQSFSLFSSKETGRSSKKIKTESIEFNKMFSIEGDDSDAVLAALSPAIQMELIDLKGAIDAYSMVCDGQCALMLLHKKTFWPKKIRTNFWKSPAAHEEDLRFIEDYVATVVRSVKNVENLWD